MPKLSPWQTPALPTKGPSYPLAIYSIILVGRGQRGSAGQGQGPQQRPGARDVPALAKLTFEGRGDSSRQDTKQPVSQMGSAEKGKEQGQLGVQGEGDVGNFSEREEEGLAEGRTRAGWGEEWVPGEGGPAAENSTP